MRIIETDINDFPSTNLNESKNPEKCRKLFQAEISQGQIGLQKLKNSL